MASGFCPLSWQDGSRCFRFQRWVSEGGMGYGTKIASTVFLCFVWKITGQYTCSSSSFEASDSNRDLNAMRCGLAVA